MISGEDMLCCYVVLDTSLWTSKISFFTISQTVTVIMVIEFPDRKQFFRFRIYDNKFCSLHTAIFLRLRYMSSNIKPSSWILIIKWLIYAFVLSVLGLDNFGPHIHVSTSDHEMSYWCYWLVSICRSGANDYISAATLEHQVHFIWHDFLQIRFVVRSPIKS